MSLNPWKPKGIQRIKQAWPWGEGRPTKLQITSSTAAAANAAATATAAAAAAAASGAAAPVAPGRTAANWRAAAAAAAAGARSSAYDEAMVHAARRGGARRTAGAKPQRDYGAEYERRLARGRQREQEDQEWAHRYPDDDGGDDDDDDEDGRAWQILLAISWNAINSINEGSK